MWEFENLRMWKLGDLEMQKWWNDIESSNNLYFGFPSFKQLASRNISTLLIFLFTNFQFLYLPISLSYTLNFLFSILLFPYFLFFYFLFSYIPISHFPISYFPISLFPFKPLIINIIEYF